MRAATLLAIALFWAAPALAQPFTSTSSAEQRLQLQSQDPRLKVGRNSFALPVVNYVAPDGTFKKGSGIIVGHDIGPGATVGLGLFKMKPKYKDDSYRPAGEKSKKVAVGLSVRF
ncbi:MAG TPA: hypothetical protein VHN55_03295 [Sphingomicrobium sp.]|nr:hypothetical protein [Sphingomicrobium sp.]